MKGSSTAGVKKTDIRCQMLLLLGVQVGENVPRRISVPFVLDLVGNGGRDVLSTGLQDDNTVSEIAI